MATVYRPILGLLFLASLATPPLCAFMAAFLQDSRVASVSLGWLGTARVLVFATWIFSLAVFLFHARRMSSETLSRHLGKDPQLVVLIGGFMILMLPLMVTFLLFLLGNPVVDVYVMSVLVLVPITVWSWSERRLLRSGFSRVLRSYTITLGILGLTALSIFMAELLGMIPKAKDPSIEIMWTVYIGLVAIGCIMAMWLRWKRSLYAGATTYMISSMLVFWFPFGLIAFAFWLVGIRPKETFLVE